MSSVQDRSGPAADASRSETIDVKLEVVVIPVSDWYAEYMVREQAGEELPS